MLDGSPPACHEFDNMHDVLVFLSANPAAHDKHDFVEIFGGAGGVGKVGIRRKLVSGPNIDINVGLDLTKPNHVWGLFQYLDIHSPTIVVMGPPCASLGPWSAYNRVHHYDTWLASYNIGLPLAKLSARVAQYQLDRGRHFVCENPWLSALWKLPCWLNILGNSNVVTAYADQCMHGLKDPQGFPTRKPTAFVASSELLVKRLRATCDGSHTHVLLAGDVLGISRTKFAQTWPALLCERLVAGMIELLLVCSYAAFPASLSDVCNACKQHMAADDNRHTRLGECKFPDATPANWLCKACSEHKRSKHVNHIGNITYIP